MQRLSVYLLISVAILSGVLFFKNVSHKSTSLQGEVIAADTRGKPVPTPTPHSFYRRTTDWIAVPPKSPSTIIHGCDLEDIAISGGLDQYTGRIEYWRTIRSVQSITTGPNTWTTTVFNDSDATYSVQLTTLCLKKSDSIVFLW